MSPRKAAETDKTEKAHVKTTVRHLHNMEHRFAPPSSPKLFLLLRLNRLHEDPVKALVDSLKRLTDTRIKI